MLFISGLPLKWIALLGIITIIAFGFLVYFTPYLQERVKTFIDPSQDPQDSSYQIQQ